MKRLISFLLCLCMILPLFGCTQEEALQKPVTFYYRRANIVYDKDDGVVSTERRESIGHEEDILYLLGLYLAGPQSAELAQTFPDGMFIVSIQYVDNTAKIIFSFHLAELAGIDLTVACACITMTMIELTGVESVQISAAGALLDDYQSITMDKDCLFVLDNSAKAK